MQLRVGFFSTYSVRTQYVLKHKICATFSSFITIVFLYLSKLNQIMKKMNLTVHLYYGGEHPSETKHTQDIEQARRWVADACHGEIINDYNIIIE